VSAEGILRRAVRLLPASRAEYGEALLAELGALPNNERRRWLLGGGAFVLRELVIHNGPYAAGLACAVLALVAVDRSPSDIANQASLLVLLLTAGGLGLTRPHRAWIAGLVVGSCLAAAHAAYLAWGVESCHIRCPRRAGLAPCRSCCCSSRRSWLPMPAQRFAAPSSVDGDRQQNRPPRIHLCRGVGAVRHVPKTAAWSDAAEPCTSASVADVFAPTLLRLRLVLPN
jgi:hypothetical protein